MLNKNKTNEIIIDEVVGGYEVKTVRVQALVSFDQKNDAYDFGFGWHPEERIWAVWMPVGDYTRLYNSASSKKTFEIKVMAYKTTTGTIIEKIKKEEW